MSDPSNPTTKPNCRHDTIMRYFPTALGVDDLMVGFGVLWCSRRGVAHAAASRAHAELSLLVPAQVQPYSQAPCTQSQLYL